MVTNLELPIQNVDWSFHEIYLFQLGISISLIKFDKVAQIVW